MFSVDRATINQLGSHPMQITNQVQQPSSFQAVANSVNTVNPGKSGSKHWQKIYEAMKGLDSSSSMLFFNLMRRL